MFICRLNLNIVNEEILDSLELYCSINGILLYVYAEMGLTYTICSVCELDCKHVDIVGIVC